MRSTIKALIIANEYLELRDFQIATAAGQDLPERSDGEAPDQRNSRKKARTSRASDSGCSSAAKCPPFSITLQRRIFL
jgi:hypothetical protein